jgi:hypothetical protein
LVNAQYWAMRLLGFCVAVWVVIVLVLRAPAR